MESKILSALWTEILIQLPLLLPAILSLIVALRFRRKAPAATPWVTAGFVLACFSSALVVFWDVTDTGFRPIFVLPAVRGLSYLFLLVGVYAGRGDRTVPSESPRRSIWQPVKEAIPGLPHLKSVFIMTFVSVFMLVLVVVTLTTFVETEWYASNARIILRQTPVDSTGTETLQAKASSVDARVLNTECEVIRSGRVLGNVVATVGLNRKWGEAYNAGQLLKTSECIEMLLARMEVNPVANTDLMEISFCSENPEEAAELANAVAGAYGSFRNDPANQTYTSGNLRAEILDFATPGIVPVRPHKGWNILRGLWTGLWLGLIAGVVVAGVAWKAEKPSDGPMAGQAMSESPLNQN